MRLLAALLLAVLPIAAAAQQPPDVDGAKRTIEATAFPLLATGGEMVGAVAMFWEIGGP